MYAYWRWIDDNILFGVSLAICVLAQVQLWKLLFLPGNLVEEFCIYLRPDLYEIQVSISDAMFVPGPLPLEQNKHDLLRMKSKQQQQQAQQQMLLQRKGRKR